MVIDAILNRARHDVAALLTDTVTVSRQTGVITDQWGSTTPVTTITHEGPGLVQDTATTRQGVTVVVAETVRDLLGYVVKLPTDVDVRVGDVVQVTASLDARQVGRTWKVLAVPTQAWALLRRCPIDPM